MTLFIKYILGSSNKKLIVEIVFKLFSWVISKNFKTIVVAIFFCKVEEYDLPSYNHNIISILTKIRNDLKAAENT